MVNNGAFKLLLLAVFSHITAARVALDVTCNPPYCTPGPGNNVYTVRAASFFSIRCLLYGNPGTPPYYASWSTSLPAVTAGIRRRDSVRATDSRDHTCRVTDSTRSTLGSATITANVVGIGIVVFGVGDSVQNTMPNNSLVVSFNVTSGTRFRLQCYSESTQNNVGEFLGLDGSFIRTTDGDPFEVNRINPAGLGIRNVAGSELELTASDQGVYTCHLPDKNGNDLDFNIGMYPSGFNTLPTVTGLICGPERTLTCTSTGSPATTVTWRKDGVELDIDGSTYQLTQTVTDRRRSSYENTLSVVSSVTDFWGVYSCRVGNSLGVSNQIVVDLTAPIIGVRLMFRNEDISNNSYITHDQLGTANVNSLVCLIDHTQCYFGDWYYPDGNQVAPLITAPIYISRESGLVRLHCRSGYNPPTGIYCCKAFGSNGTLYSACVGLYPANSGRPIVTPLQFALLSELNAQTTTFDLTCISEGGPVERVDWNRNGMILQNSSNFSISQPTLTNTVSATYHSVLTVTGRLTGQYTCQVSSTRPESAGGIHTDNHGLQVGAAHSVTNLRAEQVGPNAVNVSWTPPTRGNTVTGYKIYYQREGRQGQIVNVDDPRLTKRLISNFQVNLQYTIKIVALSQYLPSPLVGPATLTLVPPPARPLPSVQMVSPTTVSVSWSSQPHVDHYELTFERKNRTQEQCPSFHHKETVIVDGMDTDHTLHTLQEFSSYTITLRAVNPAGHPFRSQQIFTSSAAPSAAPQTPTARAISPTAISFQWNSVSCIERNSYISQYKLYYGPVFDSNSVEEIIVAGSDNTGGSYTITGLQPFTMYSIQVAAVNSDGQSGPFSDAVLERTHQDIPSPVLSLSTTQQATSVQVVWQAPSRPNGIIIAYEVHYWQNGEERQAQNVTVGTSVQLVALIPESEYTISVRAYTIAGPGPWTTVGATTLKIYAVESAKANTMNATALHILWTRMELPGWNVTYYTIYYSAVSAPGGKIAFKYTLVVPGNTTSAVLIAVDIFPGLVHQLQVSACLLVMGDVFEGRKSLLTMDTKIVFDKEVFQLQIGPVEHCSTWSLQVEKASQIEAALKSHLVNALSFHCNCSFSADFLREGAFTCWTTPTMLTYRNTIVGTKTHSANQLMAVLQQWVTLEPVLKIERFYVKVNADCPASISSLGDPECDGTATGPTGTRAPATTEPPSTGECSCPDSACLIRCIGTCTN